MKSMTAGEKFRKAIEEEHPLQVVGAINAYAAVLAESIGFKALYLSGAGVANACYGLPDLGMTTLDNVLCEARKIVDAVDLPLLVDIDTGWGNEMMVARSVRAMERAGVAAVHIEDQPFDKVCGHRPNKSVVKTDEMLNRIKAAVDARENETFVIVARTDALAVEGIEKTLERCVAYEEAGADIHFIEAVTDLAQYKQFSKVLRRPILANITEFGKTPLFTKKELAEAGVGLILYPLSAWRAMNLAALRVYQGIREQGTQKQLLDMMQTREELYGFLDYEEQEKKKHSMKKEIW